MDIESVLDLLRPEIRSLKAYDNLRGATQANAVILDSNENVISPTEALTKEERFRYPLIRPEQLIDRLASLYAVRSEQILLGRGSDDIIDILIRAFCNSDADTILQTTPCFVMYSISAQIQGAKVSNVMLEESDDYQYNIGKIIEALSDDVKLIFLASPQSPTGQLLRRDDLRQLLQAAQAQLLVIDEAYIEFSGSNSMSDLVDEYPNLVVTRTLSKAYGLANLRCGALIAHAELIKVLRPVLTPYALAGIVVETAYDALADANVARINRYNLSVSERKQKLMAALSGFSFIEKIYPSATNFLLCRVKDAAAINSFLKTKNIFIRSYSSESLLGSCARISVGSDKDIDLLVAALNEYSQMSYLT